MRVVQWLLALGVAAAPVAAAAKDAVRPAQGVEQRFAHANAAKDGHLTLDEAKAGWKSLVPHFEAIDRGGKGYVTVEDVKSWEKARREAKPKPRSAPPAAQPVRASAS